MAQIWKIFAHGVVELIREFRFTCDAFIACVRKNSFVPRMGWRYSWLILVLPFVEKFQGGSLQKKRRKIVTRHHRRRRRMPGWISSAACWLREAAHTRHIHAYVRRYARRRCWLLLSGLLALLWEEEEEERRQRHLERKEEKVVLATAKVGEKRHRYVPPKKKRPPGSHRRKEKRRGKEKEWFSSSSYLQKPKNHLGAAAARSTKKNKVGRFLPTAVDRAGEEKGEENSLLMLPLLQGRHRVRR